MNSTPTSTGTNPNRSRRIHCAGSALLLVDIQERLLPAMWEAERTLERALQLARGAALLQLPILVTEQYRKGLGPTVPTLASAVPGFHPQEKLAFSGAEPEILDALRRSQAVDVLLAGIEAHVCVTQTALDLLDAGFRVVVLSDACSSRTPGNCQAGLDRMRQAGAIPATVEMVLFELLERAGTEPFKQILNLMK
jgi:nicotinamidase-related amidase